MNLSYVLHFQISAKYEVRCVIFRQDFDNLGGLNTVKYGSQTGQF